MRLASFPLSVAPSSAPDRRHRPVILGLVILLHALLLLLLLRLGPKPLPPEEPILPTIVDLIAEPTATPDRSRAAETPSRRTEQVRQDEEPETLPPPPEAPPVEPRSSIWSKVIPLTRDELAATDEAITTSPRAAPDGTNSGANRSASSGITDDSDGPGSGPNGEKLYNARWQREPTNAELSTYLPPGHRRSGWGIVACRTVPGFRVEDCHEIAQSPGSGLAGAIRRAAWQFRVMPPRIGGRPMVGEWVRIRIDYTVTEAK